MKNKFKERLRELRLDKHLTQQDLSKLLGFGRTTVNEWEIKGNEPNIDTLIKIAQFFDVTLDYLVGLED
jgi:transcriptional regulator with XRE-family HTH domain